MIKIKKTKCPKCCCLADHHQDKLNKARCSRCGSRLYEDRQLEIFVACSECKIVSQLPAFGWTLKACVSCGNQIAHPTAKPRGTHQKGNAKNQYRLSMMLPPGDHTEIEELAEKMNTTKGAIVRFMVRLSLNMLS